MFVITYMTTRLQKGLLGDFPILYRFFLLLSRRKNFRISEICRIFADGNEKQQVFLRQLKKRVLNIKTLLIINKEKYNSIKIKERRLVMKKMLLSLIAITMLSTGITFAQRRSGHRDNVRTESYSPRGNSSHHDNYARDINRGHNGGVVRHEVIHHEVIHHQPARPVYHRPHPHHVYHRPYPHHVYHERVVVAPVAYSYPCPPPPPAPVVVVEPAPAPAAITIGALAGAIIGGTIAAAASR